MTIGLSPAASNNNNDSNSNNKSHINYKSHITNNSHKLFGLFTP